MSENGFENSIINGSSRLNLVLKSTVTEELNTLSFEVHKIHIAVFSNHYSDFITNDILTSEFRNGLALFTISYLDEIGT